MDLTALTVMLAIGGVIVMFAVVRALMDGQRTWAIGIAVCMVVPPIAVVLAITYVTNIRNKLEP